MYNPYEAILAEISSLKTDIATLSDKIPEEVSVKKYSPKQLADVTPLSEQTIINAIRDGRIKAEKFSTKYLITDTEFNRVCKEVKSIKYKRAS
ncbi:helix-turn-helix domain-containing protein [Muricauda sp. 2012CJ35-5]|uniref:Helix-turn-helix domain-containing protein n=1 Tax=Flagellimonas spongiicola TaxID=2942208 RepID=A0ABT0PMC0_9FLAO|nr:helix-turn-helix domain-containing protein [Allomuricauda spongiicola]MCL6272530.1 helix-turn-helix domain-containing protein [Allomuricauda spongiicola]